MAIYSLGRIFWEQLRVDPSHEFLGQRVNFYVALVLFVGAIAFFVWSQRRPVDEGPVQRGRGPGAGRAAHARRPGPAGPQAGLARSARREGCALTAQPVPTRASRIGASLALPLWCRGGRAYAVAQPVVSPDAITAQLVAADRR